MAICKGCTLAVLASTVLIVTACAPSVRYARPGAAGASGAEERKSGQEEHRKKTVERTSSHASMSGLDFGELTEAQEAEGKDGGTERPERRESERPTGRSFEGMASYYAAEFHGRKTASGERYNMHGFSAAHRELPFGTRLRVTNTSNKKSVLVRVNDRGPFKRHRVLDLSWAAAKKIGLVAQGVAHVKAEVLK